MKALTIRQPWADLIMAGVKDVENRSRPVPSTWPQWKRCDRCGRRSRDGRPERGPGAGIHYTDACSPPMAIVGDLAPDGPFPVTVWVHAAAKLDRDSVLGLAGDADQEVRDVAERWIDFLATKPQYRDEFHYEGDRLGALLGPVDLVGQHQPYLGLHHSRCSNENLCSRWAEPDRWHYQLANPRPLDRPIPWKGRQGWWDVPDNVEAPRG